MCLAMQALVDSKTLAKMPVTDYLPRRQGVGMVGGEPMLDLCYEEDSRAEVDANIVMTGAGRFVELGFTADKGSFADAEMEHMLTLARAGIQQLIEIQKKYVKLP